MIRPTKGRGFITIALVCSFVGVLAYPDTGTVKKVDECRDTQTGERLLLLRTQEPGQPERVEVLDYQGRPIETLSPPIR